jgi:hypothetical protein
LSLLSTAQPLYTRFPIKFSSCFSKVTIGYHPSRRPRGRGPRGHSGGAEAGSGRRVRSHCRFRNRGTEYVSESGMERMSGGARPSPQRAAGGPDGGLEERLAGDGVVVDGDGSGVHLAQPGGRGEVAWPRVSLALSVDIHLSMRNDSCDRMCLRAGSVESST